MLHDYHGKGVVRIIAETERDMWFSLGAAHAQKRLWQMDIQRKIGAGRLSEVRTLVLNGSFRVRWLTAMWPCVGFAVCGGCGLES